MSYVKPRDWVEDFTDENYAIECAVCKNTFRGHKRRVTCKLCTLNGPPTESEQAQAIAEIKWRHKIATDAYNTTRVILDIGALLEIVDSQSQKIAQLTKERDAMTATAYRLGSEAQQHISEARKIAEKMRDASERPGGGHTLLPWEKQ